MKQKKISKDGPILNTYLNKHLNKYLNTYLKIFLFLLPVTVYSENRRYTDSTQVINLGSRLELFVDSLLIEDMEGFIRPGIGLQNWVSRSNYPARNVVQTGHKEKKTGNGIVYQTEKGFIKLQVCNDAIIRVVVSPVKDLQKRPSLMITDYPDTKTKWTRKETPDYLQISTDKITARINKAGLTVSFYDKLGNLLVQGDSSVFKPAIVSGENVYHIKQKYRLSPQEAIYGLGQYQNGMMNYRGQDVVLFQENTVAVVPMFVSTKNYGILWDNYSLTRFHDGDDGTSMWSKVADAIDYYFMAGNNLDDVIKGYRFLTGKAPMFGKWAYGYWQSKERYHNQNEIVGAVRKYREQRLPLDNIVQDWMYWGDLGWNALDFDRKKFPDPKEMIDTIHKMNAHIMISIWPNFATKTQVYKEMKKRGFLIGSEDNQNRGLYDPYNKKARDYYWQWLNRNLFSIGMDAWWMDASEPEVSGKTITDQVHNIESWGHNAMGTMARYLLSYSLMTTKGVYENQRLTTDQKRVFILTRSAYAGQQRYAAVTWSGDIHARWEVFRHQISAGINFCMAGIPYWTTDIGAFIPDNPLGNKDNAYRELYVRWFQFGTFCPIFRSHGTGTAREIYNFGDKDSWSYRSLKKFDQLRYRLMPYLYSLAWQVTRHNYTIMRGLPFDFADDPNVLEIDNEYMFGPAFLVTPVTRKMYFKKNYTGEVIPPAQLFDKNGKQGGLTAKFFHGIHFDTLVAASRISNLDINWNAGASRPKIVRPSYYSLRLSGELKPRESGTYTIVTTSNDGIRVKINGQTVVENWTGHGVTINMGDIDLQANKKYKLTIEYFQLLGSAITKVAWITPSARDTLKEPSLPPDQNLPVYLPAGMVWYDFWRGTRTNGGKTVEVPAPINEIPLFVRAGTILPMGPDMQWSAEKPAEPVELRIYTGADASFTLYEDENDNYNYEKGIYATIPIRWNETTQTLIIGKRRGSFPGMLKTRTFRIVWVGTNHGTGVDTEERADKIITYHGDEVTIKK